VEHHGQLRSTAEDIVRLNGEVIDEFAGIAIRVSTAARKHGTSRARAAGRNSGYIGLQNHEGAPTVYFKEVAVKTN